MSVIISNNNNEAFVCRKYNSESCGQIDKHASGLPDPDTFSKK